MSDKDREQRALRWAKAQSVFLSEVGNLAIEYTRQCGASGREVESELQTPDIVDFAVHILLQHGRRQGIEMEKQRRRDIEDGK